MSTEFVSAAVNTDARNIPADRIPARIMERLANAGVHSLEDWRRLGRRRREIFGVTTRWVEQLDELARKPRP